MKLNLRIFIELSSLLKNEKRKRAYKTQLRGFELKVENKFQYNKTKSFKTFSL